MTKHLGLLKIQRSLASVVYKFSDKKSAGTSSHTGTETNFENQQLADKL